MTEPEAEPPAAHRPNPPGWQPPGPDDRDDPSPKQVGLALAVFRATLLRLTPRGFVTEALVAINVLVFVIMVVSGVSPTGPTSIDLIRWGADYGPRTTSGEWWRMLTSTFVHIGVIHVAMNMYVLWTSGRLIERIFGNVGFLVLYVASGLAGSLTSLVWSPFVVSAGASGAVFGIYGGLAGFLLWERGSVPREALATLQRSAIYFVGYNLLFGLGLNKSGAVNVDMAAHLGGLAGGFLAGLVLAHPLTPEGAATRRIRAAACAAGTAVLLVLAARAMPPAPFDYFAEVDRAAEVEKRVNVAFRQALNDRDAGKSSDAELAEAIDTRVLPEWRAARERFERAKGLPDWQAKHVSKIASYMAAREEVFSLVAEAKRTGDVGLLEKANEKQAEAERLMKEGGK